MGRGSKKPVGPEPQPPVTPAIRDANKATVLATLKAIGATDRETRAAILVAYAESDFDNRANDRDKTFGVFQQDPRWWGPMSEILDIPTATKKFMDAYRRTSHPVDLVADVWQVQNWTGDPDHPTSPFNQTAAQWEADPRTLNYRRRMGKVDTLISDANYFRSGKT